MLVGQSVRVGVGRGAEPRVAEELLDGLHVLAGGQEEGGLERAADKTDLPSGVVSGTTRPESRPGFARVLALAGEGAFSVLLVWKFDRLARHLTYTVTTATALRERHSVVLRPVTEPIDTATAMGEMIFAVLSGMAQQEHQAISERTMAGKREKAAAGGFTGGPVPYGYATDPQGGLVLVPGEAETVPRHAFRRGLADQPRHRRGQARLRHPRGQAAATLLRAPDTAPQPRVGKTPVAPRTLRTLSPQGFRPPHCHYSLSKT